MKRKLSICLYLALGCLLARTTLGDVLFSTFGTNDSFEQFSGVTTVWNLLAPPQGSSLGAGNAARFQTGAGTYTLSSVSLALGYLLGTNNLAIRLVADNGGQPTGPLLETIISHPVGITDQAQVVTYPSSLDPVLAGGSSYWLVVEPAELSLVDGSNNGAYNWFVGANFPIGATGYRAFDFSTQDWIPWDVTPNGLLPAFRIEGFAVPEPNAFSLVVLGAALFGFRWRHR